MIPQTFSTQSLALACAIHTVSLSKLECIEFSQETSRATFHFDRAKDPSFDAIISQFWARQLPIDALSYFEALKYFKSRLYQEKTDFRQSHQ